MLLQYLSGYRGSDVSERAKDVDEHVKYTAQELEDLIALWAVRIWQNHAMEGVRPPGEPEGEWSPNKLYQYGISTTGIGPRALDAEDGYSLMEARQGQIDDRGVKVNGLWYDNRDALSSLRRVKSPYGGKYKGKWPIRFEPRDLNWVYLYGPSEKYIPLRWIGAIDEMPAFNLHDAEELRAILKQRGIAPESTEELTYILLTEILQSHEPVKGSVRRRTTTLSRWAQASSRSARDLQLVARDYQLDLGNVIDPVTGESFDPATGEVVSTAATATAGAPANQPVHGNVDPDGTRTSSAVDGARAQRRVRAQAEGTPASGWRQSSRNLLGALNSIPQTESPLPHGVSNATNTTDPSPER